MNPQPHPRSHRSRRHLVVGWLLLLAALLIGLGVDRPSPNGLTFVAAGIALLGLLFLWFGGRDG